MKNIRLISNFIYGFNIIRYFLLRDIIHPRLAASISTFPDFICF